MSLYIQKNGECLGLNREDLLSDLRIMCKRLDSLKRGEMYQFLGDVRDSIQMANCIALPEAPEAQPKTPRLKPVDHNSEVATKVADFFGVVIPATADWLTEGLDVKAHPERPQVKHQRLNRDSNTWFDIEEWYYTAALKRAPAQFDRKYGPTLRRINQDGTVIDSTVVPEQTFFEVDIWHEDWVRTSGRVLDVKAQPERVVGVTKTPERKDAPFFESSHTDIVITLTRSFGVVTKAPPAPPTDHAAMYLQTCGRGLRSTEPVQYEKRRLFTDVWLPCSVEDYLSALDDLPHTVRIKPLAEPIKAERTPKKIPFKFMNYQKQDCGKWIDCTYEQYMQIANEAVAEVARIEPTPEVGARMGCDANRGTAEPSRFAWFVFDGSYWVEEIAASELIKPELLDPAACRRFVAELLTNDELEANRAEDIRKRHTNLAEIACALKTHEWPFFAMYWFGGE